MTRLSEYKWFLCLLRRSLGIGGNGLYPWMEDIPLPELTHSQWEFIYSTAVRQGVVGIMYGAVQDLPVPADIAQRWLMATMAIEQSWAAHHETVERQRRAWAANGIDAVLLKGLESAGLYPHPELRACGDIDWWIRGEEDWDKAIGLLETGGIEWEEDSDGDLHYNLDGIVVEHHRKGLLSEGPEGVLLMLCDHVLHHAMVAGVGMKHVCDYIMALRFYEGRYDKDSYQALLDGTGLAKWERTLLRMPDTLLRMILGDGNFGLDKKWRFSGMLTKWIFFMHVCPTVMIRRWWGLILGRVKRK